MKEATPASALAALEALFAPKKRESVEAKPARPAVKMVTARAHDDDPRATERSKLLARLLAAEGRPEVTKCADDVLRAGFTFAEEQDVQLALLLHSSEERVRDAVATLERLLVDQAPKRRAVLEARLRSLEDVADEASTRDAAATLRRKLALAHATAASAPSSRGRGA